MAAAGGAAISAAMAQSATFLTDAYAPVERVWPPAARTVRRFMDVFARSLVVMNASIVLT